MSETSVKKSIQLIHEKFTDLLTDESHSIIVSSLLKSNQSKYYIFELQSTIIRLIQKDNTGLKREWEYAFNSTGDIFLNNVNVSTELSNEFTKLLSDVSLDINENKVEIFKAESVNSIPKNRSGVISALPGRNEKFLHIKQLSKEELKQISGGCGGIAPIGVGVRPSLSPFTPVTTEHATNTTRMETVMKDLAPNSRLIPNANRDVLPILSGNIETLVDFLRHTPATLSADHENWSRDIDVTSVPMPVANAMTVEDLNRNQQTQTAKTTSFKDLIKNYQTQKTALKGILDESKRITEPSDEKRVQGTFESGLKTLINAAETIQLKIDMWVDLKGGDKTDKNFEKIRSLQSHLSSDLNKLSDESSQLRNVITADNQPIYERVKDLSLKSAVKVTQFNEGVGAERDVISTPDTTPSLDGLPKPKEAVKMDDFSRLETELNRFLAGTVGTRETHEFSFNSVTYNKTDKTLTIEFNSVGGDTRHKSVVIPFKDHNHFTSLKEAESILKEGSLGPKTESGSKLGSNRLFSKLKSQSQAMSDSQNKIPLLSNFNRNYNALIKSLKPIVTEQINKESGVQETHDYEVMAARGKQVQVVSDRGSILKFTVKPTRRREFSETDRLKNRTFSPTKREDGTHHITAKNDDLLIKGTRSDGKKSIRKLSDPNRIAIGNKKMNSSMVLRTVTEIKNTIPKEMFDECLPKETSIYQNFKNKFFKKATRHADFSPTKTWVNMMKDDLNPMSPANKGVGGKILWGLKAVAFPITMVVNGVVTGMVHSKQNWFGLRSTTKKFKENYNAIYTQLKGEASRKMPTTVREGVRETAQTTKSTVRTMVFSVNERYFTSIKTKYKRELERFDNLVQGAVNTLGVDLPDTANDIRELDALLSKKDYANSKEMYDAINTKLGESLGKREDALSKVIQGMQSKLLPTAQRFDKDAFKTTLQGARQSVNALTQLYLTSANQVQSIKSELIKGTIDLLKTDLFVKNLDLSGEKDTTLNTNLESLFQKLSDYESTKSGSSDIEQKENLKQILDYFETSVKDQLKGHESDFVEPFNLTLTDIMETYRSDREALSVETENPYQHIQENVQFQLSLFDQYESFTQGMTELPKLVMREFRAIGMTPVQVPLDPDDINRRMVDIGKQMFIVANKPTLDADNFTKVVAQLRDLQVLIQTKILEVDNLKLGSAKQRATVERIRPEIERLMGLNQTKIGDMLTKFMLLPKMIGDGKDSEKIDELVRQIQDSSFHLRTNDSEATRPSGSGVRADSPVRGPSLETTSAEMLSEDRQFFGTVKDMTSMFDEAMNATHSKTRKKTLSKLSTSFRIALLSQREDKLNAFMEMMKEEDVKTHHGALKRMDGLLEKATLFSAQFVDKFGTVKSENLRKIEEKLSGMGLKNFEVYDYVDRSISGTIELAINSWSTGMFGSKKEPRVYILKIPTPAMVESGVTELNFVRHIGASENEKSAIKTLVKGTGLLNPTVFSKGYEDLKMDISGMKKTKATLTLKTEAELDAENELAVASPERGRSDDNGIEIISLDGFMGVNQFTFSDVTACNALFNSPSSLPDVLTVFNMPFEGTSLDDFPKIVEEGDQKYEITATQESEQAPIQLVIKEQDRSAGDTVLREQKITCFTSETEISDVDDQVAEQFINRMTNSSYASNLRAAFQADYETQTVSSHVKTFLAEHIVGSKSTITLTPFETQIAKKIIKMPELLAKLKPEAIQIKMSDNIDKTMDLFDDVAIADLSSVLDTISPEEVSDLNKLKDFASSTSVFNELIENSVQMLNTSSGSALNRSFDKAFEQFSKTKNQLKLVAEKMCKDTLKTVINDDPVFFSESLDKMLSEIEKKLNTEFLVKVTLELIKKMPELDCDDVVSPDKLDEKVESHIYDLKNRTEVAKKINKRSMELLGVVQFNEKEFNLGITRPLALQLGEIDGAHTDIVLDDSSELNVKTFKLSSLIHQRVLQVASDLDMYLFSSLKEGGVKLSSNISMDKVLTHKILHEQTSSDKFKEKLASLKSSKSYLSALPDSYKLVGIGYSDFAEGSLKESLVTDIRILTDSGEETLITFEPEEPYDKKILRSLTTILSKEEKKKPAVIAYEKKQLKASIVEKYLGMETGSLRGKKIEIKEPVFSHSTYSSSKMVGVSISIQGRSTASTLSFNKVSDEDASLKTGFLDLWEKGKKELVEEVKGLTQSNTRAELFEEDPVSQELKESYLENHNRLLNIDIERAVDDILSGKKQASVDAIIRGIKHDAIVSRTDPINLTDVAKADKDSCVARVDEAKKEYDTSYTQKVKEFNGEPHRRAKAQEILNKIIGNSDIKIDRVSVDDSGKITDIFIKKRDRKDVVSYKTINRVKSALKQSPFKNDLDGFLDEINLQVSDLVTDETTRFKEDASLPVTVAKVSSAVNSLIADTSLDMFDMKPAVEGKSTEDEISKMFEALESVKATIFKPINDMLDRLPDGLQGVIPKEEISFYLVRRDTYEVKKALEKMPAAYQVMFKRLTGLRVMVDRELNKLDESYHLEYRTMPDGTEFETENFLAGLVSPDEGHSKNDHLLFNLSRKYGSYFANTI